MRLSGSGQNGTYINYWNQILLKINKLLFSRCGYNILDIYAQYFTSFFFCKRCHCDKFSIEPIDKSIKYYQITKIINSNMFKHECHWEYVNTWKTNITLDIWINTT